MNRIIALTILILAAYHSPVKSQEIPPPNPGLVLNIVAGNSIQFTFNEMEEYENGIMNAGHFTYIRVGSIYDWKLQFNADEVVFSGTTNPANQMELNNVGVIVVSIGTNMDDGSNIINYAKTIPIALESNYVTLLTKGTLSNKGYGLNNSFMLNWEMGTQRGNMNNQSILEQMVPQDTYSLIIYLTLSVY